MFNSTNASTDRGVFVCILWISWSMHFNWWCGSLLNKNQLTKTHHLLLLYFSVSHPSITIYAMLTVALAKNYSLQPWSRLVPYGMLTRAVF